MADTKLSALTELATTPANDDEAYIRDVSEAASAESKRITVINLLASTVVKALFDAHSILYAVSDNTPAALTVAPSTIVGRKSSGNIVALTASELRTLISVENGATADLTGPEIVALLEALGSGSRLSHDKLDDVSVNDHHAQSHSLASHSTKAHSELSDAPENAHHTKFTTTEHSALDKEFFAQVEHATGGDATWGITGRHPGIMIDGAGEYAFIEFHIPQDFSSIVSALVIGIVQSADAGIEYPMRAHLNTDFGSLDEGYNRHSDSYLGRDNEEGHATVGDLISWDLAPALTAIAVGDFVGMSLEWVNGDGTHNTTNCRILGVLFRYN